MEEEKGYDYKPQEEESRPEPRSRWKILSVLAILVVAFSAVNVYTLFDITGMAGQKATQAEKPKLPEISIVELRNSACTDCFDMGLLVNQIGQLNVNITKSEQVEFSSGSGKDLMEKYNITKVPVVIITGEIGRIPEFQSAGVVTTGNTVLIPSQPPYFDTSRSEVVGLVDATMLTDSSCGKCFNMSDVLDNLKLFGVKTANEKTVDHSSAEGKKLIAEYGIKKIPAMILSEGILEYEPVKQIWDQLNARGKGGFYVIEALQPPYRNLSTGGITGIVSLVMLSDISCAECYNVSLHREILNGFRVAIGSEFEYEAGSKEGRELIGKYNITQVPTILLSPEAKEYDLLAGVWTDVGSVEKDGWFVFRNVSVMGAYKDMATSKIINVAAAE